MALQTPIIAGLLTVGAIKLFQKQKSRNQGRGIFGSSARSIRAQGRHHGHRSRLQDSTYPYTNFFPSYYGYTQCNALCVSRTPAGALVLLCSNESHPWNGMDVTRYSSCYNDANGAQRCVVNIGNGLDVPVCVTS